MNCSSVIDLGCFNSCQTIDTGLLALENGTYTLHIDFLGAKKIETKTLSIGASIVIDSVLNENYEYTVQITSPSGLKTCYKFKTYQELL